MDALDESPNTSGIPSARESVLQLLKELVDLHLPNVHICLTSRPEIDIQNAITSLSALWVSLHDQNGQKNDIADYVRTVVYSNSESIMRRWKKEDKELVIKMLSEQVDGMYVDYFVFVIPVSNCQAGSDGHSVCWKFFGIVFHRASGVLSRNYRSLWMRHTSVC
jgi:hypothetical protein